MKTSTKKIRPETKLTYLNDFEADEFLKKYNKIIFLESRKRTQLPGIGREDLEQACKERLLAGFHTFDENKSSEKTWAVSVIKKTLNGIWNHAFKKKRVCMVPDENGVDKPVRDKSIEYCRPSREDLSFIETYKEPQGNNQPIYGTTTFSPEEYLEVLQTLKFLKTKLSSEAYNLVEKELIPGINQLIEEDISLETDYSIKEIEKYEIYSIFSNLKEKEIQTLSQIANFFINVLGFEKEQILGRTKTVDIIID